MLKIASLMAALSFTTLAHAQVTVSDSMGTITLDSVPKRVVVLGVGPLDALDAFGINPVAVTKLPQAPDYLSKYQTDDYPSAGSLFEPDFENIYEQQPDLIISGPRNAKNYKELSKIAPTFIYATDDKKGYWESTQEEWHKLGKIFDIEPQVDAKIAELDKDVRAIQSSNQSNPQNALMIMSSGGKISAFGSESRFSMLYKDFSFKEAATGLHAGRHGDLISYEFIHDKNPDVLFVLDREAIVNHGKSNTKSDLDNQLVNETSAVKNNKLVFLDTNAWYVSIAGVHSTEDMIDDIKRVVEVN